MRKQVPRILLALLLFSCAEEADERTRILEDYLRERFDRSIPDGRTYFVIVPHGCQGAIIESLRSMDPESLTREKVRVIASNEAALRYVELPEDQVLWDRAGTLDRLALPLHGLSLIVTEDGTLKRILSDRHCNGNMGARIDPVLKEAHAPAPSKDRELP